MASMSLRRLVIRELSYRKLDFGLGVLAVTTAVACLVAVVVMLESHDDWMNAMGDSKEEQTAEAMRTMENDYRVITKGLGYNILILHRDQDLGDFLARGFASKRMPEQYVERLASSEIVTIQHLLPALYERIDWPEQDGRQIIVIGVRGEVPHLRSNGKEPMLNPVPPGSLRIGYVLHKALGVVPGQPLQLLGRDFTVVETCPQQGNTDDITVWIALDEAQELLGHPREINAILALSCVCAEGNVERVREELGRLLPETQTVELGPQAAVRYQGRTRAARTTQETVDAEVRHHAQLRYEREALAAWLVPLIVLGSMLWIGLLALANVRERRTEIGIWRALGFSTGQVLRVFMLKAVVLGVTGALLGFGVGHVTGLVWSIWDGIPLSSADWVRRMDLLFLGVILLGAPMLASLASWIPSLLAAQQDPAAVLREE